LQRLNPLCCNKRTSGKAGKTRKYRADNGGALKSMPGNNKEKPQDEIRDKTRRLYFRNATGCGF